MTFSFAESNQDRLQRLVRHHLRQFQTYDAVEPPEVLAQRAGLTEDQIIKINGNENPYGPSPHLADALAHCSSYHVYPDPVQRHARQALALYTGLEPDYIVAGAGADEIIMLLLQAVLDPGDKVVNCVPTFGMYSFSTSVLGGEIVAVPRDQDFKIDVDGCLNAIDDGAKVVFICSPNNPTGNACSQENVERLLQTNALIVVDETYVEFSGNTLAHLVPEHWNLVVLRSLSKWAGLAGLRVGYGLMAPELVDCLMAIKSPYNLSTAAEVALLTSLADQELLLSRVQSIIEERDRLLGALRQLPHLTLWPSEGNFLLCRVPDGQGRRIYTGLAERGIFVRYFDQPRLQDCIRISASLPEHTDTLVQAMGQLLKDG